MCENYPRTPRGGEPGGTYVTLDDDAVREAALADPRSFLMSQAAPLAIDEIQLGGDRIVRMIKQLVDEDPTPARFLLTGSREQSATSTSTLSTTP